MKRNLLGVAIALLLAAPCLSAPARARQQDKPEAPKIIRKSGGVLQGSAIRRVEPTYPPTALAAKVSGTVVVEVTLAEDGKVIAARAISGHPLLKDAAVNAARGWEFTPTQLNGEPVKVIGTIAFNFHLDYKEEIEKVRQEIAQRPNDPKLYDELGHLYANAGEYQQALEACQQALTLRPDYARAWMGIARAYEGMQRHDEAIDAYKRFVQLDPDSMDAYGILRQIGVIYFNTQRYQEAVETWKQAIAKRPDDESIYRMLVEAYLRLGDRESAMAQYRLLKERQSPMAEELLKQINGQQ
jgi:TonB family protein